MYSPMLRSALGTLRGEPFKGGSDDITTPFPAAVASRADAWRLFKVLDASGQALAYVYARETPEQADIAKGRCQSKILNTWSGHRTAQIDPERCRKINGREIRF